MAKTIKIWPIGSFFSTEKGFAKGELFRVDTMKDDTVVANAKPVYLAVKVVEITKGNQEISKAFLSSAREIVGSLDGEEPADTLLPQFTRSELYAGIALNDLMTQPIDVSEGHPYRSILENYFSEDYVIA